MKLKMRLEKVKKITLVTLSVCCRRDTGLAGESSGEETGGDNAYVLANVSRRHETGQNSRVTFGAAEADFRERKSKPSADVRLFASQVAVFLRLAAANGPNRSHHTSFYSESLTLAVVLFWPTKCGDRLQNSVTVRRGDKQSTGSCLWSLRATPAGKNLPLQPRHRVLRAFPEIMTSLW